MGTGRLSQNDGIKSASIGWDEGRQSMSFKEYNQDQAFLLPLSLHDFVQEGHLARVINAVIEELDLGPITAKYSDLGCTAYNPGMMVKVLFYGYALGERSSRVIAHKLTSDVAYMYLAAMQCPDFRTICRFRKDHADLLHGLFVQIVRLCMELGMVSVGTIAMDSTKIKANASYEKTKGMRFLEEDIRRVEEQISHILQESEKTDAREDRQIGESESPYEVTAELRDAQSLKEKLLLVKERLRKTGEKEVNLTDKEAVTMLHRQHRREPSYNGQIAVEKTNGVIVAASLSNNPADYGALKELIEQTHENIGEKPSVVLADSGYSSYENLGYLEEQEITGYIPDQWGESMSKGTRKNPGFDKSRFAYQAETDTYCCPEGKKLIFRGLLTRIDKPAIRIYRGTACSNCEKRPECTRASCRTVSQDPREHLIQKMRQRLKSAEGRSIYERRKTIVEPVFGDIKQNRRVREFLLRGTIKAQGEFLLLCITHNIRKIAKYMRNAGGNPLIGQSAMA
jgi:transposase